MFIEILFKILLFKGGVLIYAEHCIYIYIYIYIYTYTKLTSNISTAAILIYIYIYIYIVYPDVQCSQVHSPIKVCQIVVVN